MASPPSLKIVNPKTAWVVMMSSFVLVLLAGIVSIVWLSSSQNQKLVDYEFKLVLKGNGDMLRKGDLRGFSEGLMRQEKDFFLSVLSTVKGTDFEFGQKELRSDGQCSHQEYLQYELSYCRGNPVPTSMLSLFLIFLLCIVMTSGFILARLANEMVISFKGVFDLASVNYPADLNFSKAWGIAKGMAEQFKAFQSELVRVERDKARFELAKQVAHDIRSPVTALRLATKKIDGLSEAQVNLIKSSTARIQAIANDLLRKPKSSEQANEAYSIKDLYDILDNIVAEKRLLALDTKIKTNFEDMGEISSKIIELDADVFSRIISNLVDNSLQALDKDQGLISISCTFSGDNFVISVEDNGKGISADLVSKLWAKGASFGKSSGTGLGLYHARSNIESWGGHCLLKSVEGKGTRVEVRLKTSS